MRRTGEWGKFFHSRFSAIPYNHSMASRFFPKTKQEALIEGYQWYEENIDSNASNVKLSDGLPKDNQPIKVTSSKSKRTFLITAREIKKYRELEVPLPRNTYDERIHKRASNFAGVELINRRCDKTSVSLKTVYGKEWEFPLWEKRAYEKEFFG